MESQKDLHKELDLIQGVISRMANNSFLIKGWTMTLMSALIAFGKESILSNPNGAFYLVIMLGIVFPFWWLDSYYLKQEKLFRKIYEKVIADPSCENRIRYNLHPDQVSENIPRTLRIMATDSTKWFYLPFVILISMGIAWKIFGLI